MLFISFQSSPFLFFVNIVAFLTYAFLVRIFAYSQCPLQNFSFSSVFKLFQILWLSRFRYRVKVPNQFIKDLQKCSKLYKPQKFSLPNQLRFQVPFILQLARCHPFTSYKTYLSFPSTFIPFPSTLKLISRDSTHFITQHLVSITSI